MRLIMRTDNDDLEVQSVWTAAAAAAALVKSPSQLLGRNQVGRRKSS